MEGPAALSTLPQVVAGVCLTATTKSFTQAKEAGAP